MKKVTIGRYSLCERQISWLKSYIKPILVMLGVICTGTVAYKMWQARTKKTVVE